MDVTTDELGGPYDAIMALCVLQHVDRGQLPAVLERVAGALPSGGVLLVSIREGVGEPWEIGDSGNPYYVVLWSAAEFEALLGDAGLATEWSARSLDSEDSAWLTLLACKQPSEAGASNAGGTP